MKKEVLISIPDLFYIDSLEQSTLSPGAWSLVQMIPSCLLSLHISPGPLLIPLRFQLPQQRLFPMVFLRFILYFSFYLHASA